MIPNGFAQQLLRQTARIRAAIIELVASRYWVLACFVVALILRVVWLAVFEPKPVSDFLWYYERGLNIAAGGKYAADGVLTTHWPIGYSAFLAGLFTIFGPSLLAAKLANVALYLAAMWCGSGLAGLIDRVRHRCPTDTGWNGDLPQPDRVFIPTVHRNPVFFSAARHGAGFGETAVLVGWVGFRICLPG